MAGLSFFPRTALQADQFIGNVNLGEVRGDLVQNFHASPPPAEPELPWRGLTPRVDIFSWLRWTGELTALIGRDGEMTELYDWATGGEPLRARFVSGPGGIGKTRLAAELARRLQGEAWSAGFIEAAQLRVMPVAQAGAFWILDYPEEHLEAVRGLLARLGRTATPKDYRLRLLLLSRKGESFWQDELDRAGVGELFDHAPLPLEPIREPGHAYAIFTGAQRRVPANQGFKPQPVDATAFDRWLDGAPENRLPLFIAAAAIFSVLHPERSVISVASNQIIDALVRREISRLRRESEKHHLNEYLLERLLAFAAIRGPLSEADFRQLADPALEIGFPATGAVVDALHSTGRLGPDGTLEPPAPDLVAAVLVKRVLTERWSIAPEWLWAAIVVDPASRLDRLFRLAHDVEIVLGQFDHRLGTALERMVANHPERCGTLAEIAARFVPAGQAGFFIIIWKELVATAESDDQRVSYLNNLSICLSENGNFNEALEASREAVRLCQTLADIDPDRYTHNLAKCLSTHGNRLNDTGDQLGALGSCRKAVEIFKALAVISTGAFLADLAGCLNNLSNYLNSNDYPFGALDASREAARLYQRLAEIDPIEFTPMVATSLCTLSNRYLDTGNHSRALKNGSKAEKLFRTLVAANAPRFRPDLAKCLGNLSLCRSAAGDRRGALSASREAVELYRTLAATAPSRFTPDLVRCLNTLSSDLQDNGDPDGALERLDEAIRLIELFALKWPDRYERWQMVMRQKRTLWTGDA
ncbi:MAG: tetratricopeptide repeat protein [Rhodospirillaceae bacterium]